eukprot:TRINITY_DN5556_c0_g1_i1.p1 TRINITY_DN5556_c0_g1~~TRINITY_DN5556_c0_g1_i1.p1  ORF type:complete len:330 (-),score=70.07 TRINITY_DN5556_c0_g1_i1:86-1012(-)
MSDSDDRDDVHLLVENSSFGSPITANALAEHERTFDTPVGPVKAVVLGDPSSQPTIVTYHDIGLTYANCFGGFLSLHEVQEVISRFAVVHMIAPGNEENAPDLAPESYPTSVHDLVSQVASVLQQLKVHHTIGFGLGAGATILLNYALENSGCMVGLFLVGLSGSPPSWASWVYHKAAQALTGQNMDTWTPANLISRHFCSNTQEENKEMIEMYTRDLEKLNFKNMMLFSNAYMNRPEILEMVAGYRSPILVACGREDGYYDDTVQLYGALNPEAAEFVDLPCGHLVMEECPHRLIKPLKLFLYSVGL